MALAHGLGVDLARKHSFSLFLFFAFCMLVLSTAHASNLVSADHDLTSINVAKRFYYIEDPHHSLTPSIIKRELYTLPWKKLQDEEPNFGYNPASHWFWLEVENESVGHVDWLLEISYPILDEIDVHVFLDNGEHLIWRSGDTIDFNRRPIEHHNHVFPIHLDTLQQADILILVQSAGSIQVPATLWGKDSFYQEQQLDSLLYGIFLGLFIVMILYNLFLYISVKDNSYLFYVLFASCFVLFFMSLSGYGYYYLWPDHPKFQQYSVFTFISVTLMFLAEFTIRFLKVRERHIWYLRLLELVQYCSALALLGCLFLSYEVMIQILMFLSIFAAATCTLVGFGARTYLGNAALIYTSAWIMVAVGIALLALNKFGVLPSNWLTQYSVPAAAALQALLLSFALGYRIQDEQHNRQIAEKNALKERLKANQAENESQQIRIAAEAESRAKNEFLAMMSHEIRTPLNGIMGMSDLLKNTQMDDTQRRYVNTIYHSGESLLGIINDILDFSKILAGKLEIESVPIHLLDLLDQCAGIFAKDIKGKNMDVTLELVPAKEIVIKSDPVRLRQVILNYLSNAIKFTEQGSVQLILQVDSNTLQLKVKDTGIGIPLAKQASLFKAFAQADTSTTRQYGGTGLGLAICKKIAELMGGDVSVESSEGEGSTFEFYCQVDPQDTNDSEQPRLNGKKVALLVNHALQQSFISQHIFNWGGECLYYEDIKSVPKNIDYCFVENEEHILAVREHLGLSEDRVFCIGDYRSQHNLRQPLTTLGVLQCFKPVTQERIQQERSQDIHDKPLNGLHILVAEDNEVNQMVIKALLRKLGAENKLVENGEEVITEVQRNRNQYDVILMDCEMPIMDGFAAATSIRQDEAAHGHKPLPIIALTAHAMDIHKKQAKQSGMDDFVSKPIKQEQLVQSIQQLITC